MIADIQQYGSVLQVRNETGQEIGWIPISANFELVGFCSEFLVVRDGGYILSMNHRGEELGSMIVPTDYRFRTVTSSGFLLQSGANLLERYDPSCRHLGSQPI